MTLSRCARAFAAAFLSFAFLLPHAAFAAIADYEFQLVTPEIAVGPTTTIDVRLINKATQKPVPDAVIFATRLDMAPDGMAEMATRITATPTSEPGLYRFTANVSMAGGWQLSLAAKIQGEADTLQSKLILRAKK